MRDFTNILSRQDSEKIVDNSNLYIKEEKGKDVLISEIFVDDIIFGGKDALCKDFFDQMKHEFEMSMFGEIKKNCWIASKSIKTWYICNPIKIYQGNTQNIWFR